ncbi:putative integral membrane protein [Candida albicans]|uniref:Putative integral membrane protein n=1 Tax=Candida albicans TaxID=5476 RepID=A0A8H6BSJ9_CANAX|nr:putative integral membrane protein [Candida albicans]
MITTTSISSVILTILKPLVFIYQFIYRVYWSGLNQRNILQLILNFCINFTYHLDQYIFETIIGGIVNILGLASSGWLLYRFVYQSKSSNNNSNRNNHHQSQISGEYPPSNANDIYSLYKIPQNYELDIDNDSSSSNSSNNSDIELESFPKELLKPSYNQLPPINFQDNDDQIQDSQLDNNRVHDGNSENTRFAPMVFIPQLTSVEVGQMAQSINNKILNHIQPKNSNSGFNYNYSPINSWDFCPSLLLATSWFLLNFVHYLREPIRLWQDYLAWTSYVLGHITVPIVTAVWLYVFHAPGSLKAYSFALGLQNICGVLTHLLFPNAAPWFIHMNGENANADYDTPGYAAGLIRVDIALGTHLTSNGFHASPIVFGALPSLHSAMAVMTFFFVGYYSRWYLLNFWHLYLLAGLIYACIWFTIIYKLVIKYQQERFIMARLKYQFNNGGSTMGMRVFRNTKIQWFFDPLSNNQD